MRALMTAVLCALLCVSVMKLHAENTGVFTPPSWQEIAFPALSPFPLDTQPAGPLTPPAAQMTPEPYSKDEFPQWAQDLWRGGVIFVGSLPFTFFFTLEGYDLYRYAANGFVSAYAPWPFRPASDIAYSAEEQIWLIAGTLTASLLVSTADYLFGVFSEDR